MHVIKSIGDIAEIEYTKITQYVIVQNSKKSIAGDVMPCSDIGSPFGDRRRAQVACRRR